MKKMFLMTIVFAFLFTACGKVEATVPNTKEARASQAILEQYLATYNPFDADKMMLLYAENVVWVDYGMNDGPFDKKQLDAMVHMSTTDIKVKGESYLLTPDGRFGVIQTALTMKSKGTGKWVTTPATCLLEFKDGKIINESWYYDGEVYKQ